MKITLNVIKDIPKKKYWLDHEREIVLNNTQIRNTYSNARQL